MTDIGPSDYFEWRSEEERAAAALATDVRAAQSHLELASCYQKLARNRKDELSNE